MNVREIKVRSYLTKSKLPESDYVVNPFIGCSHKCKYCYAEFMKRFTNHKENWGEFVDIKLCNSEINIQKLNHKTVFFSSVTDPYNHFEKKYRITRRILKQFIDADTNIHIATKSDLILRDIDILTKLPNLKVAISLNTLDEKFRKDMDAATDIDTRINTLRELHKNNIYTVLFLSPIFPEITKWKELIQITKGFVNEYWFEDLNLRGNYKHKILRYIETSYLQYYELYKEIYIEKNRRYWQELENDIVKYCEAVKIKYKNFFYH